MAAPDIRQLGSTTMAATAFWRLVVGCPCYRTAVVTTVAAQGVWRSVVGCSIYRAVGVHRRKRCAICVRVSREVPQSLEKLEGVFCDWKREGLG